MKGILFTKICDPKTLFHSWMKVKQKGAGAGIDELTIDSYAAQIDKNIRELSLALQSETYVPEPIKRIYIDKLGSPGEKRPIAVPSIKDRIVQDAVKSVIEPLFERHFSEYSYGYRPGKGPQSAVLKVEEFLKSGDFWAACCDINDFFDAIDPKLLFVFIGKTIWELSVLRLVELWLKMGYIDYGVWKEAEVGIPQGNVLSPLFSNIYLDPFDQEMSVLGPHYVRYADDFIILADSREKAEKALEKAEAYLKSCLSLRLNPESYAIRHIDEGFIFLGFLFKGKTKTIADEKISKIQQKIRAIIQNPLSDIETIVSSLNDAVTGWKTYYRIASVHRQFQFLDNYLISQMSACLRKSILLADHLPRFQAALLRVEFFGEKTLKEKKNISELILAKKALARDAKTVSDKAAASRPQSSIVPVDKAVERKKKEYEKILSKENDLLIAQPGAFLGKTSRRVCVRLKGKKIQEIPFFRLKSVVIISQGVTLSTNVIQFCTENAIPIHFLDMKGKPYAMICAPRFPIYRVSAQQVQAVGDHRGIRLAIGFVQAKIKNQIHLLKYFGKYQKRIQSNYESRIRNAVDRMEALIRQAKTLGPINNLEEIRAKLFACEGQAAGFYWELVKDLLGSAVYFKGRERKGATDLVNSLLNYGYGVLYSRIFESVIMAGLNPTISFLHKEQYGKPTLIFDMIEEFRQPIVDRSVFAMIRKNEKMSLEGTELSKETRRKLIEAMSAKLYAKRKWRHKELTFAEIIREQANSLARFLEGKSSYKPFVETW